MVRSLFKCRDKGDVEEAKSEDQTTNQQVSPYAGLSVEDCVLVSSRRSSPSTTVTTPAAVAGRGSRQSMIRFSDTISTAPSYTPAPRGRHSFPELTHSKFTTSSTKLRYVNISKTNESGLSYISYHFSPAFPDNLLMKPAHSSLSMPSNGSSLSKDSRRRSIMVIIIDKAVQVSDKKVA